MAFIKTNGAKGHEYYSICESYREDNKVKHRTLLYIGGIDELKKFALKGFRFMKEHGEDFNDERPPNLGDVYDVKTYSHGAAIALYIAAEMLNIEGIIDEVFPMTTVRNMPRGRVLVLSAIHRAIKPGSKRAFSDWVEQTSLPYYLRFEACEMNSQAFWDAMDGISAAQVTNAWNKIVREAMDLFDVDLKDFHLDYSNYFTWIDTDNGRCLCCQRGHNKQKRDDLKQFNLAMLTAMELQIPFVWDVYDGNINDKTEFPVFVNQITDQIESLGIDLSEITVSFDGGSNSVENFSDLRFHIVCACSIREHKELYDIDLNEYITVHLSNGKKRLAYRVNDLTFFGINGTGVLTFSKDLFPGQVAELNRDVSKAKTCCSHVNERLKNPKSKIFTKLKNTRTAVLKLIDDTYEINKTIEEENKNKKGRHKNPKQIPVWDEAAALLDIVDQEIFEGRKYLKHFISVELGTVNSQYVCNLKIDESRKTNYVHKYYGKKLTATDHKDWTTERILEHYGNQECIENGIFRVSKDTDHFAIRPQYHWTDDKTRVHTFICLCAIAMAEILRKLLKNEGIDFKTKSSMLDELAKIRDGWVIVNNRRPIRVLERLNSAQQAIWNGIKRIGICRNHSTNLVRNAIDMEAM